MDSRLYSKCRVINEVWERYHNDKMWSPFFLIYDIGIPLARLIVLEAAEPNERGVESINETWLELCRIIMVDPEGDYDLLDEMLVIGAIEDES